MVKLVLLYVVFLKVTELINTEDLQYLKKELFGDCLDHGIGNNLKELIQAVDYILPLWVSIVCESGQHSTLQMTAKMVFRSSRKTCY